MKRICIYHHFSDNKNQKMFNYVFYALKNLSYYFDKIIFVSNTRISYDEITKINNISWNISLLFRENKGYDFGGYKDAYKYIKNLSDYDELCIMNSTCFFPINCNWEKDFKSFTESDNEILGNSLYNDGRGLHIQSYFCIIKKSIFMKEWFNNFFMNINEKESNIKKIIKQYELGFSKLIIKNKVKYKAKFILNPNKYDFYNAPMMIVCGSPFLKLKSFSMTPKEGWSKVFKILKLENSNYPINNIKQYINFLQKKEVDQEKEKQKLFEFYRKDAIKNGLKT